MAHQIQYYPYLLSLAPVLVPGTAMTLVPLRYAPTFVFSQPTPLLQSTLTVARRNIAPIQQQGSVLPAAMPSASAQAPTSQQISQPKLANLPKTRQLIDLGIESIKQGEFERGLSHFQHGFNLVSADAFFAELFSKWHRIVVDESEQAVLRNAENRIQQHPRDCEGRFVKALCCVSPEKYSIAMSLLGEILTVFPHHAVTQHFLTEIRNYDRRNNRHLQTVPDIKAAPTKRLNMSHPVTQSSAPSSDIYTNPAATFHRAEVPSQAVYLRAEGRDIGPFYAQYPELFNHGSLTRIMQSAYKSMTLRSHAAPPISQSK